MHRNDYFYIKLSIFYKINSGDIRRQFYIRKEYLDPALIIYCIISSYMIVEILSTRKEREGLLKLWQIQKEG